MKVPDRGAEKQPPDKTQDRIADIAVQPRHGAGRYAAGKPVAHDEVGAAAKSRDESIELRKIVAVVAIAHDDEAPLGGGDASRESRAIAALADRDDPSTIGRGNLLRAVVRAVIGDEHLA